MTPQATINFNGMTTFNVLDYSYSFHRGTDDLGKANTDVFGGMLNVTVSQFEKDKNLIESILSKAGNQKGTLIVKDGNGDQQLKKIEFSEGYMVAYEEMWNQKGSGVVVKFTVGANLIAVDDVKHEAKWPSK
jgi:hypothetical protein